MTHQIDLRVANERCKGLAIPIVGVGSPMGYVSIMYTNNKEIDKDATLILQQTAAICALVILKQKEITNLEQQFRWDFADQLISNMYSNEDSIIAWGSRLGYDITKPHRIITMAIEYAKLIKLKSQEEQFLLKKNILSITNNHLKKAYPAVICADVKNNLAIFLPEKTTDHIIILNICNTLKKEIEIKFPKITILVGIGGIAQSCQDYSKKLLEADKAVHILKSFKKKDSVLFYDDLGSLSILFEVNKKQDLLEFMNRKLGPLIEYDYKHNSELIKSLDDYLTTDSLRKTANNTAISLSGLKYRLNKIKEFGYNLNSPQERFDLQLALQIFKVTQL
jgi:purine catabolism regulator